MTTPRFFNLAGQEQVLQRLVDLFQQTISAERAHTHHCSRLVMDMHVAPLFGRAEGHATLIAKHIATRGPLGDLPVLIDTRRSGRDSLMLFPVPLPLGDPLVVSLAFRDVPEIDRPRRARLNGLATIYAMKALPLWEIEEDIETASPLTLKERVTLAMTLAGSTHCEIAERLGCSIRAISGHADNAVRKLQAIDEAQAIALAARRGWLHLPHHFGIADKTLDH